MEPPADVESILETCSMLSLLHAWAAKCSTRAPCTHKAATAAMPVFHDAAKRVTTAVQLADIAVQQVTHLPVLVQLAERLIVGQS